MISITKICYIPLNHKRRSCYAPKIGHEQDEVDRSANEYELARNLESIYEANLSFKRNLNRVCPQRGHSQRLNSHF
jgi:hypothetical protein